MVWFYRLCSFSRWQSAHGLFFLGSRGRVYRGKLDVGVGGHIHLCPIFPNRQCVPQVYRDDCRACYGGIRCIGSGLPLLSPGVREGSSNFFSEAVFPGLPSGTGLYFHRLAYNNAGPRLSKPRNSWKSKSKRPRTSRRMSMIRTPKSKAIQSCGRSGRTARSIGRINYARLTKSSVTRLSANNARNGRKSGMKRVGYGGSCMVYRPTRR